MSKTAEPLASNALAPPDLPWLGEFLGRFSLVNDQRLTVQEVAHLLRMAVRGAHQRTLRVALGASRPATRAGAIHLA
jgi:hypothetical protein